MNILSTFTYAVTAAAWNPLDDTFVIASQDSECPLTFYSAIDYQKQFVWREDNLRVHDIAISPDGTRLVALLESRILVFDPLTRQKIADWPMPEGRLTSVQISKDSRHMLVGINENRIKLIVIDSGEELQTFRGHQQSSYVIRSAFGGANETFVVSGSEGETNRCVGNSYSRCVLTMYRFESVHLAHKRNPRRGMGSPPTGLRQHCCLASYGARYVCKCGR